MGTLGYHNSLNAASTTLKKENEGRIIKKGKKINTAKQCELVVHHRHRLEAPSIEQIDPLGVQALAATSRDSMCDLIARHED